MINEELYGTVMRVTVMRVTDKMQEGRMQFAGHNIGHHCQNIYSGS